MRKNLLVVGAFLAAGLLTWNEYRLWTHRSQLAPMQPMPTKEDEPGSLPAGYYLGDHRPAYPRPEPDFPLERELAGKPAGEEECDATIIDLTPLQRQSAEPPIAGAEEPIPPAPPQHAVNGHVSTTPDLDIPIQFRAHAADPADEHEPGKFYRAWKRIVGFIWGVPPHEDVTEPNHLQIEPLLALPRAYDAQYHRDHPGCPYTGGCPYDGSHDRRVHVPAGDEAQEPPAKPKNIEPKKPRVDTLEVRPGDLPRGWLWWPF